MGLWETHRDGIESVGDFIQQRPLEPQKPKPKWSGFSTLPRAVAAGVAELGANVSDMMGASAQAYADFGLTQNPLQPMTEEQRQQRDRNIENFIPNFRPEQSKLFYEFSDSLRVDPNVATTAEKLFFDIGKGFTKAIGGAAVAGPVGGAAVLGVSEGMTTAEDLANQGVDLATRTKVGAVTGVITGATAALPVAGQTLAQTAGLALVGGPAAYMAQQKITSDILSRANYVDIAQQYDPLDPVGLTVATLIPFGLGLHSLKSVSRSQARQNAKADTNAPDVTEFQPAAQDAQPAPIKTQNFEPQENVDVAMVQNLTIQRDIADVTPPAKLAADISKVEVTENPNFKNWFGDSKVVDAEGKPLVVYHGTDTNFDTFIKPEINTMADRSSIGFWFSTSHEDAGRYGSTTLPVYLTLRNPLHISLRELDMMAVSEPMPQIIRNMKNGGYDGLYIEPIKEDRMMGTKAQPAQYVVFDARQIKSAIGNSGLFDPNSASLTDQIRTETQQIQASRATETNPLKPADSDPTVVRQTIDRFIADKPDMEVSVKDDGTRVKLSDEVQAVRREIENGTDDELGLNDKSLVEAAIQCFLGE